MDKECISKGLEPSSLTSERVAALIESGIGVSALAKAIGVSNLTVGNWRKEKTEPRADGSVRLDDMRAVMDLLTKIGLEPEAAVRFINSRHHEPPFIRPIDTIGGDPAAVFNYLKEYFSIPDGETLEGSE